MMMTTTTTQEDERGGGQRRSSSRDREEQNRIKNHLGPFTAACLFLGCKMEEEPRRIRDVINLSRLLIFFAWNDDDKDVNLLLSEDANAEHPAATLNAVAGWTDPHRDDGPAIISITESLCPPPLDEGYWTAKEWTVSTEQHVLRTIQFDATVCHPHRAVLAIMETLGFGVGRRRRGDRCGGEKDGSGGDDGGEWDATTDWLLDGDQSENVISRACEDPK